MKGYFKPLRRKIGVMSLALAFVFAAGWLRSLTVEDDFSFLAFQHFECFKSGRGKISWMSWEKNPSSTLKTYSITFRSKVVDPNSDIELVPMPFNTGLPVSIQRRYLTVRYRSIVLPLALLSTWLLPGKSRAKNLSTESPPDTEP